MLIRTRARCALTNNGNSSREKMILVFMRKMYLYSKGSSLYNSIQFLQAQSNAVFVFPYPVNGQGCSLEWIVEIDPYSTIGQHGSRAPAGIVAMIGKLGYGYRHRGIYLAGVRRVIHKNVHTTIL